MNSDPSTTTKYLLGTEDIGESNPVLYNLHIIEGYDLAGAIREYSELYNLDDHYEKPVLIRKVEQWRTVGPISGFGVRARPDKTKPEQDESGEEATMKEETKRRDDIMIYDQLSKICREQLKILFPGKHISSNESKSENMGAYEMQFHIVVDPEKPHLIIGFTKEDGSSMIDIWNGKRMNKVIDIDIDDGSIRRYHEPQLYAESSNCLGYSQVSAIYTALDTFLNCDDVADERYVAYNPVILLEEVQTVIECWMKSNDIRGNACESEAERFCYDLYGGKFIKGSVITVGDEKEILIWMNTDAPVMRITPSVASLIQIHVPPFTDEEVYDLYNEISEAAFIRRKRRKTSSSE